MGILLPVASFGLGLLDFLRTGQFQEQREAREAEALGNIQRWLETNIPNIPTPGAYDYLPQQDFADDIYANRGLAGVAPEDRLSTLLASEPSLFYDDTGLREAVTGMETGMAGAQVGARDWFTSQLEEGEAGTLANLNRALADLRARTAADVGGLEAERIPLGSTVDLLDIVDPEEVYGRTLATGMEAAQAQQQANIREGIESQFAAASQLGMDPWETGAFSNVREGARNRLYSDIFGAEQAAGAARLEAQEQASELRGTQIGREMESNRALDAAIAGLLGTELTAIGGLHEGRMTTDAALRTALSGQYGTRMTGIESTYLPQIAAMETEISRAIQQGNIDEANRIAAARDELASAVTAAATAEEQRGLAGAEMSQIMQQVEMAPMIAELQAIMAQAGILTTHDEIMALLQPMLTTARASITDEMAPMSGIVQAGV